MHLFRLVIVGHVDHGKSTLIGRLLYDTGSLAYDRIEEARRASHSCGRQTEFAYLLDHLEEERRQGITIDTTQVFFQTSHRQYAIIDAPGHVEFVKNMVTGASQADGAILIVDAAEGIKEQTRRHAYLLSLLGLRQIIVAINKMDLVGFDEERFEGVRSELKLFFSSLGIEPLYYIPICATKGANVARRSLETAWYGGVTLLEGLDLLKSRESAEQKRLIFPIQDVYSIEELRIAVGRVESGTIAGGDEVNVLPVNRLIHIASVKRFMEGYQKAAAEDCIGITTEEEMFLSRGDIICAPDYSPFLTDRFYAIVFWMSKNDLRREQRITLRCATQQTSCHIETIHKRIDSSDCSVLQQNADFLKNLEIGEVTVCTRRPVVVTSFSDTQELGRFVLVGDDDICAGGIIKSAI